MLTKEEITEKLQFARQINHNPLINACTFSLEHSEEEIRNVLNAFKSNAGVVAPLDYCNETIRALGIILGKESL